TNELINISETQFFFDVRTMRFNGLYAQVEFRSDVLGSKSTSKQFDYFEFSIGERVQRVDIARGCPKTRKAA
ncbi:MAG TPA: hypothetical protein VIT23_13465, partial [Terrimicrobiaceae bacterium]